MKKSIRIIAAFAAFIMTTSCFSACTSLKIAKLKDKTDAEKAQYLSEQSDLYYADGIQQKATISGNIAGNVSGNELSATISTALTSTYMNTETDDIAYFISETTTSSITTNGESTTESYTEENGYVGGEYLIYTYIPNNGSDSSQAAAYLKSPCTPAEAREYIALRNAELSVPSKEIEKCFESVSVSVDSNKKNWILTYSDFIMSSSPELQQWLDSMTGFLPIDLELTEVSGVFTVDIKTSALTQYEIGMKLSTENIGAVELELDMTITSKVSRPTESIEVPADIEDYRPCGDLRYKYYALKAIEKFADSDNVSFNLNISQNASYKKTISWNSTMTGDAIKHKESDVFHIGTIDGTLRYSIAASANKEAPIVIKYDGDMQTVYSEGNKLQSNSQTEKEAKAFIKSCLSQFMFKESDVIKMSVTKYNDGTSKVFLHFRVTDYMKELFTAAGFGSFVSEDFFNRLQISLDENFNLTEADFAMRGEQDGGMTNGQQLTYIITTEATITSIGKADNKLLSGK